MTSWETLVSPCLSVWGQDHVCSVSSTILAGSISYLHSYQQLQKVCGMLIFFFIFFFLFQNVSFCPSFYIMLWPSLNVTSPYLKNGWSNWHRTKGIWIDMMLNSLYDLDVWPHPWPWPWIFKVKYWNCCFMNGWVRFILIPEYRSCVNGGMGKNEYMYMYITWGILNYFVISLIQLFLIVSVGILKKKIYIYIKSWIEKLLLCNN